MVKSGQGQGLTPEVFAGAFVSQQRRSQNLDGHVALQPFIVGAVNLAHAAGTDYLENLESADLSADAQHNPGELYMAGKEWLFSAISLMAGCNAILTGHY
jgi:hypothetical protein